MDRMWHIVVYSVYFSTALYALVTRQIWKANANGVHTKIGVGRVSKTPVPTSTKFIGPRFCVQHMTLAIALFFMQRRCMHYRGWRVCVLECKGHAIVKACTAAETRAHAWIFTQPLNNGKGPGKGPPYQKCLLYFYKGFTIHRSLFVPWSYW